MNRQRLLFGMSLLVVALLLSVPSLPSAPDATADLKTKVDLLVEQLGKPAKQNQAETELLKLGPAILPHLPGKGAKLSDEQKEKLKAIRSTLQEAQVLKDLAPRLVTLKSKSITLAKALLQLKEQTQIEVLDRRQTNEGDLELKLDLNQATFWQALDAIAKEADLRVSLYEEDGKIALHDGPHRSAPISYSGIFRILVKRISAVQDIETDAHHCTISLEIAWEPQFQPLFMQSKPESLVVQDDKGSELKLPEAGSGRVALSSRMTTEVHVVAEAPRRAANRLKLLKGGFSIVGPAKMLTFEFDKLAKIDKRTPPAKVPTQTREGVTVSLSELTTDSDLWTIGILLEYPPDGPDFESFESWLTNNKIFLENKKGQRFGDSGYDLDEQGGRRAVGTYRFEEQKGLVLGKLDQWKLIYLTPGPIAKVPIHFEFKDLPLP